MVLEKHTIVESQNQQCKNKKSVVATTTLLNLFDFIFRFEIAKFY